MASEALEKEESKKSNTAKAIEPHTNAAQTKKQRVGHQKTAQKSLNHSKRRINKQKASIEMQQRHQE